MLLKMFSSSNYSQIFTISRCQGSSSLIGKLKNAVRVKSICDLIRENHFCCPWFVLLSPGVNCQIFSPGIPHHHLLSKRLMAELCTRRIMETLERQRTRSYFTCSPSDRLSWKRCGQMKLLCKSSSSIHQGILTTYSCHPRTLQP